MEKFTCVVCGHIYDPSVGDPTLVSLQEQILQICQKLGNAQTVV